MTVKKRGKPRDVVKRVPRRASDWSAQELSKMVASLGHEIATPLTSMDGYLYQMKRELLETRAPSKALLQECLARLDVSLSHARSLAHGFRNVAKWHKEEGFGQVPVRELLFTLETLTKPLFRGTGVELKLADLPDENSELCLRGHASQVLQLLLNLVVNAKEAVLDASLKTAHNSKIVRVGWSLDHRVDFFVEDSGSGVPTELRQKIFEFSHSSKSSSRSNRGMGLTISQQIAKSHGSSIVVGESKDLGGARFSVSFEVLMKSATVAKKKAA